MKKYTLIIDTSKLRYAKIELKSGNQSLILEDKSSETKAQKVLPLLEKIITKHQISFDDIGNIQVMTGPGSFTGLRVGVSIARVIGFLLDLPVNQKKYDENIEISYEESKFD